MKYSTARITLCMVTTLLSHSMFSMGLSHRVVGETTMEVPLVSSITQEIAPKFGFTNANALALNFFHAVENNEDIRDYLQNSNVINNWRILTVGYAIAQKTGNTRLQEQINAVIQKKYPNMLTTK